MRAFKTDRAARYVLKLPIHYRAGGTADWHEGRTVNMSRSGVLFEGEQEFLLDTLLDMRIALPKEVTGDLEAKILCRGSVVRRHSTPLEEKPMLAARIRSYRFDRPKTETK
jgi:hypothetical protein